MNYRGRPSAVVHFILTKKTIYHPLENFAIMKVSEKTMKKQKITKKTTIGEIIKKYPKAVFVFLDYGLHCVGCPMAAPETIEEAARIHNIDLKKFLKDLRKASG